MKNIMNGVPQWNSTYIREIVDRSNKYHEKIALMGVKYNNQQIMCFLSKEQLNLATKILSPFELGKYSFSDFEAFLDILQSTEIQEEIITVVPIEHDRFVCITTQNIYGIEIHKSAKGSVFLTVYCPRAFDAINEHVTYQVEWKYLISLDKKKGALVFKSETHKQYENYEIAVIYDCGQVTICRKNNSVHDLTIKYDYTIIGENKLALSRIEDLTLLKKCTNAQEVYDDFCIIIDHHKGNPKFILSFEAECLVSEKTNSLVHYSKGELQEVQFADPKGFWIIGKYYWSFIHPEIEVNSSDGKIAFSFKTTLPDDEELEDQLDCLSITPFDEAENFIEIVRLAKETYIPKYFPTTSDSV